MIFQCAVVECNEHEEYDPCGPVTEPSCLFPDPPFVEPCMENCYCMENYMRQGKECILKEQCGCLYLEDEFIPV